MKDLSDTNGKCKSGECGEDKLIWQLLLDLLNTCHLNILKLCFGVYPYLNEFRLDSILNDYKMCFYRNQFASNLSDLNIAKVLRNA